MGDGIMYVEKIGWWLRIDLLISRWKGRSIGMVIDNGIVWLPHFVIENIGIELVNLTGFDR